MVMAKIVEEYCRKIASTYEDIKVMRIADQKTVFVKQSGEDEWAVMMTDYKVDGVTYWAGFSSRSQTVYISQAA